MNKIRVAIAGATGYTGSELLRILLNHPEVHIAGVSSESHAGKNIDEVHPFLNGLKLKLVKLDELVEKKPDVVFLGFPHGVSMDFVKNYGDRDFKIIDLSGDFRFSDAKTYKEWYGQDHVCPEYIEKAVFGLPELNRELIRKSKLIGNPGCYPTSAILPLYPLIKEKLIDPATIIVDAKSGVTGAGIKPSPVSHYPSAAENFKAYGLLTHRHTGEIQQVLSEQCSTTCNLLFTPHLLPVNRGILSTSYSTPVVKTNREQVRALFNKYYDEERFVRVRDTAPATQDVRGSNYADIFATYDERTNRILTISCIDNLVKGAAGQAVQNMNIMFNIPEDSGLLTIPMSP